MRQLLIEIQRGKGQEVLELAEQKFQGVNLSYIEASSTRGAIDLVVAHISNSQVEEFLGELEDYEELHVTLIPHGTMPLQPPVNQIPDEVVDPEPQSPLEIFLAGLQSVGSWNGFISYAIVGGIIVWIGLFTNSSFLLVASMLIAPFAGPAMNFAIATARGDGLLLKRSIIRYLAAIAITASTTCLLSLILSQELASNAMVESSKVSAVSVLLPLAGGAAGALNLVQSERSSLVSGTAVGMLVAAALAPPAGTVGMAIALGLWSMALNCGFLLILQLVGINIAAATVFRIYGLSARGARYKRGRKWIFPVTICITTAVLAGLLTLQFNLDPNLQRSSLEQRANAEVQKVIEDSNIGKLVKSSVTFTRADIKDQNTLLCLIYVQRPENTSLTDEQISDRLTKKVQQRLIAKDFKATPLVNMSVLQPPESK